MEKRREDFGGIIKKVVIGQKLILIDETHEQNEKTLADVC